ncbi:sigma 54 modulation/S30EA ribosomal C-terminal domain-containing protein [Mycolicibacterium fortuitum]|uniref:sigma 54 modulation/S30EA ribosomal C-terminal domain-containing protein n=1 Tax=Mycolicibacterium fortuitum TaxID=1766 RepID=UPI00262B1FBC|nr:sigma 54 modulation/S30EA ribosomal C-terminal domain-containing protein [Mycolicibacterium fortuitum]
MQINLLLGDTATRIQAVCSGLHDLTVAMIRLDRQIVRVAALRWRPRPWPDPTRRILCAPAEAVIGRRKPVALARLTPAEAIAVMDARDYDVHLFTDAETGEDAVVYRAGPSGLRLARQQRMHPPGWFSITTTAPVGVIVHTAQTPTLREAAAVARVGAQRLRFGFYTDPDTGRGRLLYPRYDGALGLLTPTDEHSGGQADNRRRKICVSKVITCAPVKSDAAVGPHRSRSHHVHTPRTTRDPPRRPPPRRRRRVRADH